jgi:hypothetical protein
LLNRKKNGFYLAISEKLLIFAPSIMVQAKPSHINNYKIINL